MRLQQKPPVWVERRHGALIDDHARHGVLLLWQVALDSKEPEMQSMFLPDFHRRGAAGLVTVIVRRRNRVHAGGSDRVRRGARPICARAGQGRRSRVPTCPPRGAHPNRSPWRPWAQVASADSRSRIEVRVDPVNAPFAPTPGGGTAGLARITMSTATVVPAVAGMVVYAVPCMRGSTASFEGCAVAADAAPRALSR